MSRLKLNRTDKEDNGYIKAIEELKAHNKELLKEVSDLYHNKAELINKLGDGNEDLQALKADTTLKITTLENELVRLRDAKGIKNVITFKRADNTRLRIEYNGSATTLIVGDKDIRLTITNGKATYESIKNK